MDQTTAQNPESTSRPMSIRLLKIAILSAALALLTVVFILLKALFREKPEPRTMAELKIARAEEAVKKYPNDPRGHIVLGSAYLEVGEDQEAAEEFKAAIRLAPELWLSHYGLGNAYVVLGETKNAIKEFKLAIKLAPEESDPYYVLGKLYLDNKKYDEALKILEKAVSMENGAADSMYLLGQVYEAKGKKDQAIKEYKEALRYIPDFTEAREALDRLEKERR